MNNQWRGFTLLELLVSIAIFMIIMIAVYSFFDQGQWLYLKSEKQSNSQQNARLVLEQMERDIRMIGSGVPRQGQINGGTPWTPYIFTGDRSKIYFHADIDNRNTPLQADASGTSLTVEDGNLVCPLAGMKLVIVKDLRTWRPISCTAAAAPGDTTINITPSLTAGEFLAKTSWIQTPETIFYRLTNDSDDDGICDVNYPFCKIEKVSVSGNNPATDEAVPATFQTLATNVEQLRFDYMDVGGTVINGGTLPLTTDGQKLAVGRIRVTLTTRDRSSEPGKYVDINLRSDILIREDKRN